MSGDSFDTATLNAIAPLREAGFAIHWLHARTKRPIGDEWSEAPVLSLDALRRTHRAGNNTGVRLGEPSLLVSGDYLQAIDTDIRIPELADEAWAAFDRLFPGLRGVLPSVKSGSGGESQHHYFVSDRAFRGKKLAFSDGKHRGSDGRWHHDWEIELFGTGKQVAMPPSIHPDTGLPYTWEREFDLDALALGAGPFISGDRVAALGAVEAGTYEFETREPLTFKPGQMESTIDLIPVSDLDYDDWVRLGQAIHHQTGGSDAGFDLWLQATKRSVKFLGDAQARDMRRSKWRSFGKYRGKPVTMATVVDWAQDVRAANTRDEFEDLDEPEPEPASPAAGGGGDFDDLLDPADEDPDAWANAPDKPELDETGKPRPSMEWVSLLEIVADTGAIKGTLHNLRVIVENDAWTHGVPAFNQFTQEVVQRGTPGKKRPRRKNPAKDVLQLEGLSWQIDDPINGDYWTEDKDNAIRALLEAPKTQGGYGIKVPDRDLRAAIDIAGRTNAFHPVREFLTGLTWDGVARCDTLFIDYLGSPDDAYHRSAARIMLAAAVTRVFEPGAKFDTATILEGLQGVRKSTFVSILAKGWFAELDGDVTDTQQMVELLQGVWIAELNELGGLAKADARHIKAFISRRSDKVRLAYAKRAQEYKRQSILIGSTNDTTYIKDTTGGRRFNPVKCNVDSIDTERLLLNIDQIWAEAYQIYLAMRIAQPRGILPLYITNETAQAQAKELQESRQVESSEDVLRGRFAEWLERPINSGSIDDDLDDAGQPAMRNEVCLIELWCECLAKEEAQYIGMWPQTLGRAMRMVPGWHETTRRPRFGKYGQQRAFQRDGWVAASVAPKQG